jgi:hypothetical protein
MMARPRGASGGEWAVGGARGARGSSVPNPTSPSLRLRHAECFAALDDDKLGVLEACVRSVKFDHGSVICAEGDPAEWMFVVGQGEVAVLKRASDGQEVQVAVLRPGDVGGTIAIFGQGTRTATLVARAAVELWVLDRSSFERALQEHPEVAHGMLSYMSQQLRRTTADMARTLGHVSASGLEAFYEACSPQERLALDRVNQQVAAAASLSHLIDFLFEATREISPCNRVALAFVEEDGRRVVAHYARADYEPLRLQPGFAQDLEGSSLRQVIESGQPRIIDDMREYHAAHPHSPSAGLILAEGLRSSMTCPLSVDGRTVGLLFRSSRQPRAYDAHQVRLWRAIADRISQAVEKAYRIEQLTQANRAYTEMLGFVSHELKSPVASIVLDARVMTDGYLGELTEKQRAKIGRMITKGEYLLGLVREYLDLARIESGQLAARPRRGVDFVAEVLEPVIEIVDPQRQDRRMTLERVAAPADCRVDCDPDLMKIVMANLLGNAFKYGREGGRARVSLGVAEGELVVAVWNEGPGFADHQRARLFRKFSRLDSPELLQQKGTGVGLYSTWRIVQLHHGRIAARAEPGAWAEFTFSVPLEHAPGTAGAAAR